MAIFKLLKSSSEPLADDMVRTDPPSDDGASPGINVGVASLLLPVDDSPPPPPEEPQPVAPSNDHFVAPMSALLLSDKPDNMATQETPGEEEDIQHGMETDNREVEQVCHVPLAPSDDVTDDVISSKGSLHQSPTLVENGGKQAGGGSEGGREMELVRGKDQEDMETTVTPSAVLIAEKTFLMVLCRQWLPIVL